METLLLNDAIVKHTEMPLAWGEFQSLLDLNPTGRVTMIGIGGGCAGAKSRDVNALLSMLALEPLSAQWEAYGNNAVEDEQPYNQYGHFLWPNHPEVRKIHGNFEYVSFVFSVITNDRALIERLREAFELNKKLPTYRHLLPEHRAEWDALIAEKDFLTRREALGTKEYKRDRVSSIYGRLGQLNKLRRAEHECRDYKCSPQVRQILFNTAV